MKKVFALLLAFVAATLPVFTGFAVEADEIEALRGTTLYVYNWGEYISDGSDDSLDVIAEFENRFGIDVVYDTFDNNETMYSKLKSGGVAYDIVIPSDYMIERMIAENMLEKIDYSNIPNYKYIPEKYRGLSYDPKDEYSVPYTVGMVGLIYNTSMVSEAPTSWKALWDKNYTGSILMFNNPRDAFAIAQSVLGMDYNMQSEAAWKVAAELLKEQKIVSPTYVSDEVFNMMESGDAAIAAYYAGDCITMMENSSSNVALDFFYPRDNEGNISPNLFMDAMCIPTCAKNKDIAEAYINFMLSTDLVINGEPCDVARANAEYIYYATPNAAVYENPEYQESLGMGDEECDYYAMLYPEGFDFAASYEKFAFANLDPNKQFTNDYLSPRTKKIIWAVVITVIVIIIVIYIIQRRKRDPYLSERGFIGRRYYRWRFWFGRHRRYRYYNNGYFGSGYRVINPTPPRFTSSGSGSSGGFSCACACACAGGGRAGCSRKDFYQTNLQSDKVLKQLKNE